MIGYGGVQFDGACSAPGPPLRSDLACAICPRQTGATVQGVVVAGMVGRRATTLIVLTAIVAIWPLVVRDEFYQRVGALVLLGAISGSAWNLIGGYAGQISFGHAMFFGAGAYASLVVFTQFGWPPIAGVPVGVLASLALALLIGVPTFRLRGHYFSMATIAAAELLRIVVSNWPLLGAAAGLMGPATPRNLADLSFRSPLPYYYLFLLVLGALLLVTWTMQRSRMGYYLRAINGGDRAARSLGVAVLRFKLYAMLLSAGFTAVAGSLYAVMIGFADPDSTLGILVSVNMVLVAALGGAGRLFGPLLGAAILVPLEQVTNSLFGGSGPGVTYVITGAIILLIARFEPGGVLDLIDRVRWRSRTSG
jgi:branched-chain amino acid transport system permease protein